METVFCSLGRQTVDRAEQEDEKTKEEQLSFTWSRRPLYVLIHALASEATGTKTLAKQLKFQTSWAPGVVPPPD